MAWSATLQDFFTHGLPPAACVPESRQAASVDYVSGLIELPQHGFFGGERARLRVAGSASALPTGASRLTYYPVNVPSSPDFFSFAGLTMTDNGVGVLTVLEDPTPWILGILAAVSSYVVASHTSSQGPWATPPGWAPRVAGHLAAPDVAQRLRVASPLFKIDDLRDRAKTAEEFMARLVAGKPYNDGVGPIDATPLVADDGAVTIEIEGRDFLGRHHRDRA